MLKDSIVESLPPTSHYLDHMDCCLDQPQGQMESGSWQSVGIPSSVESFQPVTLVQVVRIDENFSVPPGPSIEDRSIRSVHMSSSREDLPSVRKCEVIPDSDNIIWAVSKRPQVNTMDPIDCDHSFSSMGSRWLQSFLTWQPEIIEAILSYLPPSKLLLVSLTSKTGQKVSDSTTLWRSLLARDYPFDFESPNEANSKKLYQQAAATAAVFVTGGCSSALTPVSAVHRYALGTHRLSRVPSLSGARVFAAVSRVGCRLYVSGGCTSLSSCLRSVECLDLLLDSPSDAAEANSWTPMADMQRERSAHCTVVAAGRLYAVGGTDLSRCHASSERYDPAHRRWHPLRAQLHTARSQAAAATLCGCLYVTGGVDDARHVLASVELLRLRPRCVVNTATLNAFAFADAGAMVVAREEEEAAWEWSTPMGVARTGHALAVLGGRLYAAGGFDAAGNRMASVERYEPSPLGSAAAGHWARCADMSEARAGFGLVPAAGRLYAVGGTLSAAVGLDLVAAASSQAVAAVAASMGVHSGGVGDEHAAARSLSVELYDPATDRWVTVAPTDADLAVASSEADGMAVGGGGTAADLVDVERRVHCASFGGS